MARILPKIAHAILFSMEKLEEYMMYSHQSRVYTIVMSENLDFNLFLSIVDTFLTSHQSDNEVQVDWRELDCARSDEC